MGIPCGRGAFRNRILFRAIQTQAIAMEHGDHRQQGPQPHLQPAPFPDVIQTIGEKPVRPRITFQDDLH
jgi:hypothetical protein